MANKNFPDPENLLAALRRIAGHPHLNLDKVPDDTIETQLGLVHGHKVCADIAASALIAFYHENPDELT